MLCIGLMVSETVKIPHFLINDDISRTDHRINSTWDENDFTPLEVLYLTLIEGFIINKYYIYFLFIVYN